MHYMLLVYESAQWTTMSDHERTEIHNACWKWHDDLAGAGRDRGAAGLKVSSATTVRQEGATFVATDGPYAETKEVLGGFQTVECANLAEAVAIAKTFPALRAGFAMEVREVRTDTDMRRGYEA